jgi:hypothetical protein
VAASGVDLRVVERGRRFGAGVFGRGVGWFEGRSVVSRGEE